MRVKLATSPRLGRPHLHPWPEVPVDMSEKSTLPSPLRSRGTLSDDTPAWLVDAIADQSSGRPAALRSPTRSVRLSALEDAAADDEPEWLVDAVAVVRRIRTSFSRRQRERDRREAAMECKPIARCSSGGSRGSIRRSAAMRGRGTPRGSIESRLWLRSVLRSVCCC